MAENIFELLILGEGQTGLVDVVYDASGDNFNFQSWSPNFSLGNEYLVPQYWTLFGLEPLPDYFGPADIELFNINLKEDNGNVSNMYLSSQGFMTALNAHPSFMTPVGWSIFRSTIGNSGLHSNGSTSTKIEDYTPLSVWSNSFLGYDYWNPPNKSLIPELNLVGFDSYAGPSYTPKRIGLTFNHQHISNPSGSFGHATAGIQLDQLFTETSNTPFNNGEFSIEGTTNRIRSGSLKVNLQQLQGDGSTKLIRGSEGQATRVLTFGVDGYLRYVYQKYAFGVAIPQYSIDCLNSIYQQTPGFTLKTKKKFPSENFENNSYIPGTYVGLDTYEELTLDYQLPPSVYILEDIFPDFLMGESVQLEVTLASVSEAPSSFQGSIMPQMAVGCYTNSPVVTGSGITAEFDNFSYNNPTAVPYSCSALGFVSNVTDGTWYPDPQGGYINSGGFDANSFNTPLGIEGSSQFGGKSVLRIARISDYTQNPVFKARMDRRVSPNTTYHFSMNVNQCNGVARVKVYSLRMSNEDLSTGNQPWPLNGIKIDNPSNPDAVAEDPFVYKILSATTSSSNIQHFTFTTPNYSGAGWTTPHPADNKLHRIRVEIEITDPFGGNSSIRFHYIRFEETRYGITDHALRKKFNLPANYPSNDNAFANEADLETNQLLDMNNWETFTNIITGESYPVGLNAAAKISEAPVIVTTSRISKAVASYSVKTNTSAHYTKYNFGQAGFEAQTFFTNTDFSSLPPATTDAVYNMFPYHNLDGSYDGGNGSLKLEETKRFTLHDKNSLKDQDGCYTYDRYHTEKVNLKIGSKDLSIFVDINHGDEWVSERLIIKEIKFYDSAGTFMSCAEPVTMSDGTIQTPLHFKNTVSDDVLPSYAVLNESIPPEFINNQVRVHYNVTSKVGNDDICIDFGLNTNPVTISSTGVGYADIIAQGDTLRVRSQTEEEKGSPLTGLEFEIQDIKISTNQTGGQIVVEKIGDEYSNNFNIPTVSPYDSAIVIKNIDLTAGVDTLQTEAATFSMYNQFNPQDVVGATSVKITLEVRHLNPNCIVQLTHFLTGGVSSHVVTTANPPVNEFIITNIPDNINFIYGYIIITTQTVPGATNPQLKAQINNLKIEATHKEAAGGSDTLSLDLPENFDFSLNSTIKDFKDLNSSSASFSKTLSLPATSKNKLAFLFENELFSLSNKFSFPGMPFNNIKPLRFILKANGLEFISGFANLMSSSLDEHGAYELETNLISGNSHWVEPLKDLRLKSLPSSIYIITSERIIGFNQSDSILTEIFFPLIDNGQWKTRDSENPDAVNIGWDNVKAAFPIKLVFKKIFENIGYTLESDFFKDKDVHMSEASFEFGNFTDRLAGIAPSMAKPDWYIQKTMVDVSFDPGLLVGALQNVGQKSAFSSGIYTGGTFVEHEERPFLHNQSFLGSNGDLPCGYYIDWAYINCNLVNRDDSGIHSYEVFESDSQLEGVYNVPLSQKKRLKGNNHGATKSAITVESSGYYEMDIAINFNINNVPGTQGFLEDGNNFLGSIDEDASKTLLTVMLVSNDFAIDSLYLNNNGIAMNAFDLFDTNSVELLSTDYNQTRVSLKRNQHLVQGIKYYIVVMMGTRQCMTADWEPNHPEFNCSFVVNELDFRMKASKSPYPMGGKYSVVYNNMAAPRVTYLDVLPDVSALQFVSEITKIFNLIWSYNELTKVITVEPFSNFYDFDGSEFGFNDFTEKALITRIENNEIAGGDFEYKMAEDSGDFGTSINYSGSFGNFGDKKISLGADAELSNVANPFKSKPQKVELEIFSSLKMGYSRFISRTDNGGLGGELSAQTNNLETNFLWLPRIWSEPKSTLEPTIPEEKPEPNNSHEYKLCYILGAEVTHPTYKSFPMPDNLQQVPVMYPQVHYSLERFFVQDPDADTGSGDGLFRCYEKNSPLFYSVGSYFPFDSLLPSTLFSDVETATLDNSSLFNSYHQSLVDMLIMRDKMVTAEIYLTAEDVRNINFKQLIKIDNELYILNKIKDFNFSGEATEVELLLVTRTGTNHEIL